MFQAGKGRTNESQEGIILAAFFSFLRCNKEMLTGN